MSDRESILDQLRKIQALAERGIDGEKVVAQRMLDALLAKHGLTLADITDHDLDFREFKTTDDLDASLLIHCILFVAGTVHVRHARHRRNKRIVYYELTKLQHAEVLATLEYYRAELKKDLDGLFQAFVNKHHLFPRDGECKQTASIEEMERLRRRMDSLVSTTMTKHLSR